MGDKFAVLEAVFDGVEMLTNFGDAVGVAYGKDGGGEFLGTEVEVVNGAAAIDKEFAFRDWLHKLSGFFSEFDKFILILQPLKNFGLVAEWLGRALQKLLQQFESARDLTGGQDGKCSILSAFFFAEGRVQIEYCGDELVEMSSSKLVSVVGIATR